MINKKITVLFLTSFMHINNMELELKQFNPLLDATLTKIVTSVNYSSLELVMLIKSFAHQNEIPLIPQTIGQLFKLTPERINNLFLEHIKDEEMRKLMLSMGADINACNKKGRNCLWKIKDPKLLEELINKGANVNAFDHKGHTPLGSLSKLYSGKNKTNAYQKKMPAAKVLLAHKADPNLSNSNYLLYEILLYGNMYAGLEAIQLFLQHGMNINIQNTPEYNPLIAAIYGKNIHVVDYLLKHTADPNLPNACSEYPLHLALGKFPDMPSFISYPIVLSLLDAGASTNVPYPNYEKMPLDVAQAYCDSLIINALRAHYAQSYKTIKETTGLQSGEHS
jgi:ankyrin repeat protein